MKQLLDFLYDLKQNNDRIWFNENKDRYMEAKLAFDALIESMIGRIGVFDTPVASATVRECVFRIYRDTRFSHNKLPYKKQFSAFIAWPGGWKSARSGYYIHLEPGKSHFSAGIYRPTSDMLKQLRLSIVDNYEELQTIRNEKSFQNKFGDSIYEMEALKRLPVGFPKDFVEPDLLKLKHYIVSHSIDDAIATSGNFQDYLTDLAREAYPFNQFLNYTVDEQGVLFD